MTRAAEQLESVVHEMWPTTRFGRNSCRPTRSGSGWSEHAYENARDIFGPTLTAADQPLLDEIYEWLVANVGDPWPFSRHTYYPGPHPTRQILYKDYNTAHDNHIHVGCWPRGVNTPRCAGGNYEWIRSNGIKVFGADPDPEGSYGMALSDDDIQRIVAAVREDLNRQGLAPATKASIAAAVVEALAAQLNK